MGLNSDKIMNENNKLIIKEEDHWVVRYGDQTRTLPYKPTLDSLKSIILSLENSKIDQEIISGYVWEGKEVWLSSENQFNYKAAYDLAVQTSGKSLPVTFKFGNTSSPVYHTFETLQELTDFYTGAMGYVNETLAKGWARKDTIDWGAYQDALDQL